MSRSLFYLITTPQFFYTATTYIRWQLSRPPLVLLWNVIDMILMVSERYLIGVPSPFGLNHHMVTKPDLQDDILIRRRNYCIFRLGCIPQNWEGSSSGIHTVTLKIISTAYRGRRIGSREYSEA